MYKNAHDDDDESDDYHKDGHEDDDDDERSLASHFGILGSVEETME